MPATVCWNTSKTAFNWCNTTSYVSKSLFLSFFLILLFFYSIWNIILIVDSMHHQQSIIFFWLYIFSIDFLMLLYFLCPYLRTGCFPTVILAVCGWPCSPFSCILILISISFRLPINKIYHTAFLIIIQAWCQQLCWQK